MYISSNLEDILITLISLVSSQKNYENDGSFKVAGLYMSKTRHIPMTGLRKHDTLRDIFLFTTTLLFTVFQIFNF